MLVCRAQAILMLMKDPERLERERAELAAKRPHARGGLADGQPTGFGSDSSPAPGLQAGGGFGSGRRPFEQGQREARYNAAVPQQTPEPRCFSHCIGSIGVKA